MAEEAAAPGSAAHTTTTAKVAIALIDHCRNNSNLKIVSVVPFPYVPVIASAQDSSIGGGTVIGRFYPNHFVGKHVLEQSSAMPVSALGACLSAAFSGSDKL